MKKALIITYYWPPSGGAGVQRWLKFVKYLRTCGWEPVVYTPLNPEIPVADETLLNDIPEGITVLKNKIREPYRFYKLFSGRNENINTGFLSEKQTQGWKEKISVWIRGNFFIPDARKFWIKPSVKFLSRWLENNKADAIISSGPPHSMHLIALELKQKTGLPWLADFRDPWTRIDYYHDLLLTKCADRMHHQLEKKVLLQADAVVSVGKTMSNEFSALLPSHSKNKFHVITNGYDDDDLPEEKIMLSKKFTLTHAGTLVKTRNPLNLWKVLAELVNENTSFAEDFQLIIAGKTDITVNQSLQEAGLEKFIKRAGYLNHREVISLLHSSQVLLLVLNDTPNAKGILTGKLFEYLASRRPVLCIGPEDGDAAAIISGCKAGITAGFQSAEKIKQGIAEFYRQYQSGGIRLMSQNIDQFSRKALTAKLAEVLNQITV
jgi:glycosyltransferase involved in cell wall biosynthesis